MIEVYVLIILYWGSDRSAMATAEFSSYATCQAARVAMAKEFDGTFTVGGQRKTYSVCAKK